MKATDIPIYSDPFRPAKVFFSCNVCCAEKCMHYIVFHVGGFRTRPEDGVGQSFGVACCPTGGTPV
jgi:hypothetical protein